MAPIPRHALILGLGRSGMAAAGLLRSLGAQVTVLDACDSPGLVAAAEELRHRGANVVLSAGPADIPADCDLAVLSPGIRTGSELASTAAARMKLVGEIELAFRYCRCPVVAVTGTNGKTTTTMLIRHLLDAAGLRVMEAGNIGTPFSGIVTRTAELDAVVLETSSFQLETIEGFKPRVAVWLNLSENHLDHHADMDEYRRAKSRIFENQTPEDDAVVNAACDLPPLRARTTRFSSNGTAADFTLQGTTILLGNTPLLDQRDTGLPGVHNAENIMAALGAVRALGLDPSACAPALADCRPPAHRCETVCEHNGILWINDSKSTNPDAMRKALLSQRRPVVLIAGGKDKGFGFEGSAAIVGERVRTAILIGEMRERIASAWPQTTCRMAGALEEAVAMAAAAASPGDVVLFSPGTSSFDMFSGYEERGEVFKKAVTTTQTQT
jgi:UDP-N-acetylmuramoylalanine--D-glutamate ligase